MGESGLLTGAHRGRLHEPGPAKAPEVRNHHIRAGLTQPRRHLVIAAHVVRETVQQDHRPPTASASALKGHVQDTGTHRRFCYLVHFQRISGATTGGTPLPRDRWASPISVQEQSLVLGHRYTVERAAKPVVVVDRVVERTTIIPQRDRTGFPPKATGELRLDLVLEEVAKKRPALFLGEAHETLRVRGVDVEGAPLGFGVDSDRGVDCLVVRRIDRAILSRPVHVSER